ncbi:MAG: hypothetical protein ACI9LV_000006 [Candidatus Nanohaloarchaea archaeon]|jgi:hypothetical protein
MKKILALTIIGFLMTGIASAQAQDVPAPGITPDNPLYTFEKISERLALGVAQAPLIGSEELEAKVRANQAAETLAEARAMAAENKSQHVEKLMHRYSENMNKSTEIASSSNNSELKNRLKNVSNNQLKTLEEVERKVPEPARKGIQNAIENSQRNQHALERSAGRGSQNIPDPGNKPKTPGSKKKPENTLNPNKSQSRGSQETEAERERQKDVITGQVTGQPAAQNPAASAEKDVDTGRYQNSEKPSKREESRQKDDQRDNQP